MESGPVETQKKHLVFIYYRYFMSSWPFKITVIQIGNKGNYERSLLCTDLNSEVHIKALKRRMGDLFSKPTCLYLYDKCHPNLCKEMSHKKSEEQFLHQCLF